MCPLCIIAGSFLVEFSLRLIINVLHFLGAILVIRTYVMCQRMWDDSQQFLPFVYRYVLRISFFVTFLSTQLTGTSLLLLAAKKSCRGGSMALTIWCRSHRTTTR